MYGNELYVFDTVTQPMCPLYKTIEIIAAQIEYILTRHFWLFTTLRITDRLGVARKREYKIPARNKSARVNHSICCTPCTTD